MHLGATFLLGALAASSGVKGVCTSPEPARRICYNASGATPQNLSMQEVAYTAKYLRFYGSQKGNPAFYFMNGTSADNCAEWLVTSKGATLVLAKLVGRDWAAVTFSDIAATIDGGAQATSEAKAAVLWGCDTAGGQMGVVVNASDPLYNSEDFLKSGLKNTGIIIKIVRNPDAGTRSA